MPLNNFDLRSFIEKLESSRSMEQVHGLILEFSYELGFRYFAVTEHFNLSSSRPDRVSVINYPQNWDGLFRKKRLFGVDPVHRASGTRLRGFAWSDVPRIIPLGKPDQRILELARENGMGEGYTTPANVPGSYVGSCSFGMHATDRLKITFEDFPLMDFAGAAIFETCHRIHYAFSKQEIHKNNLTDRQLDCIALLSQGYSTNQISRILNISYETASQYIKDAFVRYGVNKRTALAIRALLDGALSFTDVIPKKSPQSWG